MCMCVCECVTITTTEIIVHTFDWICLFGGVAISAPSSLLFGLLFHLCCFVDV